MYMQQQKTTAAISATNTPRRQPPPEQGGRGPRAAREVMADAAAPQPAPARRDFGERWKSCCAWRHAWKYEDVQSVANGIFSSLKESVRQRLELGELRVAMVIMEQGATSYEARDLRANQGLLKQLIIWKPTGTPSQYFVADVLLMMDCWSQGGLLRGKDVFEKTDQALDQGPQDTKHKSKARVLKAWDCRNVLCFSKRSAARACNFGPSRAPGWPDANLCG